MGVAPGPDGEVAHWFAVAQQYHADHLVRGVSTAEVHELATQAGRHRVRELFVQQERLVQAETLEGVHTLQKPRL